MSEAKITTKILEALDDGQFHSTAGLARWIGCGRAAIVDAYDTIEAAGIAMMRLPGVGGGVQIVRRRARKAA